MKRTRIRLAAAVAAGLFLVACGEADDTADEDTTTSPSQDSGETQGDDADPGDDDPGDAAEGGGDATDDAGDAMDAMDAMDDMDDDMGMSGGFGEPADASEADRTIEVVVDNELAFEPDEYEVSGGEVVTFQISNTGDIEHEFVLGDEQAQQQMAEEMGEEMGEGDGHAHSGEMSNAVTIHPGEKAELTWRFPEEATTVLVGCHVPGHWDAGMQGSVTVG